MQWHAYLEACAEIPKLPWKQNEPSSTRLQHEGFSDIEDHKLQCLVRLVNLGMLREERKKLVSI